jgi:hypothetical protein
MAMPWDLEDWLTEIGDRVVRKIAVSGLDSLTPKEQLIYEVWAFDTDTRNGGVSHYFGNRGIAQWKSMRAASQPWVVPRLNKFMDDVDKLISQGSDPEVIARRASPPIEEVYWSSHQSGIVEELRGLGVSRLR